MTMDISPLTQHRGGICHRTLMHRSEVALRPTSLRRHSLADSSTGATTETVSLAVSLDMMTVTPNQCAAANHRPASPFAAWRQFQRASCARPSLSAAVAELDR